MFYLHLDCIETTSGTTMLRPLINRAGVDDWWEEVILQPVYHPLVCSYLARVQFSILDEEEEDVGMVGNVYLVLHFRRCA